MNIYKILIIVSQKLGFALLGHSLTIWCKLMWSLGVSLRPIKHEKRASALNHLISATNINQLWLTCTVGQTAADTDEILTIPLIPKILLSQHVLHSPTRFHQLPNSLWRIGLFSISVNRLAIVILILWQLWTAHESFHIYCKHANKC